MERLFSQILFGVDAWPIWTYYYSKMDREPKGPHASRFRQRKGELLRRFRIPAEALPGSLALTHSRCGKPNCHCASDEGHASWSLTFMVQGTKHVLRIPRDWLDDVRRRVEAGREFKQAVDEVFAANAQLLVLRRKQRR